VLIVRRDGGLSEQIFVPPICWWCRWRPAPLALRTLDQVREHLEGRGKKAPLVLPVLSMVDRRKALHREVVAAHPDWPAIPMASMVEQMGTGRPRWPNSPRSAPAWRRPMCWGGWNWRWRAPNGWRRPPRRVGEG
jgi:hypothetical protein